MKNNAPHSDNKILRQKAEEILKNKPISVDTLSLQGETLKLIHELDVHQIELEMQNEELRHAKEQIELAAEKYIDLYDFAPSGYFTLSTYGEIHKLNFKAADMLGKDRSQLLNNRFGFFVTNESKSVFSSFLDRIFESKIRQSCEVTLSVNPKEPTYLLLNGITVKENDHCFITAVDISKLKQTEIALKKSELLLHTSIDSQKDTLIFSLDPDYKYLTFNTSHCDAMRNIYNSDTIIGMNILECILSIEDRNSAKENFDRALQGESHSNIKPFGIKEIAYFESFFYPIVSNNKIVGVSCLSRDITARLQNEEAVKENEEKYRTLFDSNRDSITIFRLNSDGKAENFIDANAATTAIYGYTKEELLKLNLKDLDPIGIKIRRQRIENLLAKGRIQFETIIKTNKGKSRNVEVELLIINYLNKPAVMNITRDITERKQIEINAKKAQENLLTILEAIPDLLFEVDQHGLIHHYQAHRLDLLAATPDVFMGKRFQDILPADATKICMEALAEASKNGLSSGKQYSLDLAIGKHWFELSVSTIKEGDPKEKHFIILSRDITVRKMAEEKLIASENYLMQTQIIANLGSYSLDFASGKWTTTSILDRIFGIDANFEKTIEGWQKIIHPEWQKGMSAYLKNEVFGKKNDFNKEYKIIKINSKEERWIHGMGEIIFDKKGQPLKLIGSIQDITERKLSEEQLKQSSEKFQDLVNSTGGIVWEADAMTFDFTYVSKQAERLFGFPAEDWYTKSFWENHLHPEDKEKTIKLFVSFTKQMKSHDFVYRFLAKNSEVIWLRAIVNIIFEEGKPRWLRGVMFDISSQKENEESLRESEEKYRGLVENSPDAVVIYADGKIVFVNDEGIRLVGAKSKEEIIGKTVLQFIHPNSVASVVQNMEAMLKDNNASPTVEEKFIDLAGNTIDVELKGIPTIYEHKEAVQVIIHDISERKQSLLELNKMNRVYSLISQINNLIIRSKNKEELLQEICRIAITYGKFRMSWIGMLNDDGKTINTTASCGFVDGYFESTKGISILDEPMGKGPSGTSMREGRTIICNDIGKDPLMKIWRKNALERGYRSSISIPIVVLDKIIGSFNLYSEELNSFSLEEEVELLEKITQNISFTLESILFEEDRIKTQEKIKQLSQAVEQSPVTIVITSTNGEIEYVNPKFCETTGYSFDEIVGQNSRCLKSGHTTPEEYKILWQTLTAGNEWHGEFQNIRKDGGFYWESASISPILNAQGKTTHYIAIKEDITARKNVEKELIEAKEKAEESDRLKLAFLANMSHEIRTPMNGILGFTELLKSPNLVGEEQQEYISIIEKSGIRMLNIINDIISISKVESGQVEISLSETNVNEQIEYLRTFFKPEAEHKGLQFSVTHKLPSQKNIINTDKEKVYAILTNLIKNAIKFTDSGSIEFGCTKKDKHLEYFVKDTGGGISESQQKIIFERFRQANETITRSHEGSGLGLAISKAYVEMLGGKIWVESKQGEGSTFYFTIPAETELNSIEKIMIEKVPLKEKEDNKIKDLKVLIVEDDEISKLLITIAVKTFSKEILKVGTGFEAIEACRNNPDIDLVMMDINMPEMGGYEATQHIRKFNEDVVIIAQTANGMQSDRDEAIAVGCTDYISKPVNVASLSSLINKYFKS